MENEKSKKKKLPPECIELHFAKDLVIAKCVDPEVAGRFRRFEVLFEFLANLDRHERLLNYKFLNALMLTSHAKKTTDKNQKQELFELKNKIFYKIANDPESRKVVNFKYLVTPQALMVDEKVVDKEYFNVLSMQHRFKNGSATLFLSNDRIKQINNLQIRNRGKLSDHKEEILFHDFHYNVRNLNSIKIDSVLKMYEKLAIQ